VRHYRRYVSSADCLFKCPYRFPFRLSELSDLCSRQIADCFQDSNTSVLREPDDVSHRSTTSDELTTREKLSFWNTEGSGTPDVPVEEPMDSILVESEVDEKEDHSIPFFPEARASLIESKAYDWLLRKIRTNLILTSRKGTPVEIIKDAIPVGLSSRGVSGKRSLSVREAVCETSWNPLIFLKEQHYQDKENQAIGEVITVTGSAIDSQAMTCAHFMHQTWPSTGDEALRALQAAMA
jgi:hypothetical protein